MKLIALLIGIYAERFLARWSHLREFRPFGCCWFHSAPGI